MKRGKISTIYLNNFFRGLGFSLVGIFIPAYFLSLGYSLSSVFAYFLIFHITLFIFTPIALLISKKLGYKKVIISSSFFLILYLFLLSSLDKFPVSIYIIGIVLGIQDAFYFIPLHSYFANISSNNKRGSQFSTYSAIGQLSGIFGPLGGALLAGIFGFDKLFYLVIIFIAISSIYLFHLPDYKPKTKIKLSRLKKVTQSHKNFFFATFLDNIKGPAEGIIWPIFTFLFLKNFISIGYVALFVSIGTIIFTLSIGKFHDKKNKFLLLKLGGILYAGVWLARIYTGSPFELYIFSLAAGFLSLMMGIPYNAIFYDKIAKHEDSDEYVLFVEIPNFLGRATLWITMLLFAQNFTYAFILSAIASLLFSIIKFNEK